MKGAHRGGRPQHPTTTTNPPVGSGKVRRRAIAAAARPGSRRLRRMLGARPLVGAIASGTVQEDEFHH